MSSEDTLAYATPHPARRIDTIRRWLCRRGSTAGSRMVALAILALTGAVCQTQAQTYIATLQLGQMLMTGALILFAIEYLLSFVQ